MSSEQYNLLSTLFETQKDKIKIDDKIKQKLESWRGGIIQTALDSQEPVKLHILEDSKAFKGIEEGKKELVRQELKFIGDRYAKIYYPEYKPEQPEQQLKSMKELLAIDTGLQINKYHGGKYHEDYSDYEVLLAFFINNIELQHYCIPFYESKEIVQFILDFYNTALTTSTKILTEIFGEEAFKEITSQLLAKYAEIRGKYEEQKEVAVLAFLDIKYLDEFKNIVEMITAAYLKNTSNKEKNIKSDIELLFSQIDISVFTYARKLALKQILEPVENQTEELKQIIKADNLLKFYNAYRKSYNNILESSGLPADKIATIIGNEMSDEYKKFELDFLMEKMVTHKDKSKIDRFIDYIRNQIKYGVLGMTSSIRFNMEYMNIFTYLTLSYNYFYEQYKLFGSSLLLSSCGIYTDINFTSDIFYLVYQHLFNTNLILPIQLSYLTKKKENDSQYELDLSLMVKENDTYNFNTKNKSVTELKYDELLAILTIKFSENDEPRIEYLFIKNIGFNYNETFIEFKSETFYTLINIYGNKIYMDHIIPLKSITHVEIYTLSKIFKYCYSIILKENLNSIKINENLTLDQYYNNHTLFFSNKTLEEIKEQFKDSECIDSVVQYSIEGIEEDKKFSYFKITRHDKIDLREQPKLTGGSNKFIDLSFNNNNLITDNIIENNYKLVNVSNYYIKTILLENNYIYNKKYNFNNDVKYSSTIKIATCRNYLSALIYIRNRFPNLLSINKINVKKVILNELQNKINVSFKGKSITEIANKTLMTYDIKADLKSHTFLRYNIHTDRIDYSKKKINTNIINIDNIFDLKNTKINNQDIIIFISDEKINSTIVLTYRYIIYYNLLLLINKKIKKGGTFILSLRTYQVKVLYEFIYILEQLFDTIKIINLDIFLDISNLGIFLVCKGYKGNKQIESELLQNYEKLKEIYPNGLKNIAFSDNKLNEEYGIPYDENSNTNIISGFLDKSVKLPKEFIMKLSKATDEKYVHVYKNTKEIVKLIKRYERGEEIRFYPFKEIYFSYTLKYMIINNIEYDIKYFLELLENQKEIVLKKPKATTTKSRKIKRITNAKSIMTNTKKRVSSGTKSKTKTLKRKNLKSNSN